MASTVLLSAATALALLARARSRTVAAETFRLSARAAAESALREAAKRLRADSSDVVSRLDPLFDPTKPLELERAGMKIRVRLDPLDDRIPLRGLFLPDGSTVRREYDGAVRRLFQRVGRPELTDRFLDGLDRDKDARPGGGEASGDIDRVPSDLTELLAIPGIDPALLRGSGDRPGLAAGLTVYGDEKINLNVAEPLALGLLDARFDEETVKALVYARGTRALKSLEDLKKIPAIPADALARIANALQFGSSYFRVTIQVRRGAEQRLFVAILHRSSGGTPELVSWEE
jgi:type II secretory pathway component PulK